MDTLAEETLVTSLGLIALGFVAMFLWGSYWTLPILSTLGVGMASIGLLVYASTVIIAMFEELMRR